MLKSLVNGEDTFLDEIRAYVARVLQTPLSIEGPVERGSLPAFLTDRYILLSARILDRRCVLMLPTGNLDDTPATIAKHRSQIQRQFPDQPIILATGRLSNHNRHRLVSQGVPFVVPSNQLFVPELAVDLREHFRSEPDAPAARLTPTAQLLVLAALLDRLDASTPTKLAARLHYSPMSMGRAVAELEALQLIEVEPTGKFRRFRFALAGRELWAESRALLGSPVRKRRRVRRPSHDVELPLAGESALAALTELSQPRIETRALAASGWKDFTRRHELDRPSSWNEPEIELETWAYDPLLLGDRGSVDPLSLWLSLPEGPDERVGAARDALLRKAGL